MLIKNKNKKINDNFSKFICILFSSFKKGEIYVFPLKEIQA